MESGRLKQVIGVVLGHNTKLQVYHGLMLVIASYVAGLVTWMVRHLCR